MKSDTKHRDMVFQAKRIRSNRDCPAAFEKWNRLALDFGQLRSPAPIQDLTCCH